MTAGTPGQGQTSWSLLCHPTATAPPALRIGVDLAWLPGSAIRLVYRIQGELSGIRLPDKGAGRVAPLWAHSCCELFVRGAAEDSYREFNFSPAGDWATYRFRGYRQVDTEQDAPAAPTIRCHHGHHLLELEALLGRAALPAVPALQLGLSAVIEAVDGSLTYWALRHPAARPDFHHPGSFALTMTAAGVTPT